MYSKDPAVLQCLVESDFSVAIFQDSELVSGWP